MFPDACNKSGLFEQNALLFKRYFECRTGCRTLEEREKEVGTLSPTPAPKLIADQVRPACLVFRRPSMFDG